jgi:hypothetical protein
MLLNDLVNQWIAQKENIYYLVSLLPHQLRKRREDGGWSALECIEHLNIYARMYLDSVEEAISASPDDDNSTFKSGLLGGYFARTMAPAGTKMKTFKSTDPQLVSFHHDVIDEFQKHLERWGILLEMARHKDLNKKRVAMVKLPLLRFKLGDMLHILINHQSRHLQQAMRVAG